MRGFGADFSHMWGLCTDCFYMLKFGIDSSHMFKDWNSYSKLAVGDEKH